MIKRQVTLLIVALLALVANAQVTVETENRLVRHLYRTANEPTPDCNGTQRASGGVPQL